MHSSENRGMTMIELCVALVFLSIILGISLHSFITAYPRIHLNKAVRDLASAFQMARMEALKRNLFCTITFNQALNGITYNYVIYADADQDLEYDPGEDIISRVIFSDYGSGVDFDTTKGGGIGITFDNNDNALPSIAFNARGFPINNNGAFGSGSVFLVNERNYQKTLTLNLSGRVVIN